MFIQSQGPRARQGVQAAQNRPAAQAPKAPVQDSITLEKDPGDVSWLDVGAGLVGAVATGAIETVGNTASSVFQAAELAVEAEVALVKNETIGPWLKGGLALLTPVAAGLSVAATAVGSLGYGLYRGFVEGIHHGVGGSIKAGLEDVRDFNTELCASAREGIREFGDEKLEDGEEKFDVSPVRAGIGVVAGVGTTVQGAVRIGATTARHIPGAFKVANKAISKSEMSTPLKAASHVMTVPLAVIAAPLGIVGGALFGLGVGVHQGYTEGFKDSFGKVDEYSDEYSKYAAKFLKEAAEDLTDPPK